MNKSLKKAADFYCPWIFKLHQARSKVAEKTSLFMTHGVCAESRTGLGHIPNLRARSSRERNLHIDFGPRNMTESKSKHLVVLLVGLAEKLTSSLMNCFKIKRPRFSYRPDFFWPSSPSSATVSNTCSKSTWASPLSVSFSTAVQLPSSFG